MEPAQRAPECGRSWGLLGGRSVLSGVVVALATFALLSCQTAPLQAQQKKKFPIVGKLATGNHQQAYSGKIQSLDMKQKILNVNSLHGQDTEIFPVKKNMRVESVNGNRLDLSALIPGATVLIYFDQKSGERTIKNIVVLSSGKEQAKGSEAPSS
jgi:hypothetical protein